MSYSTSSIEGVQKSVPIFVRGLALDSGLGIVFDGSGPGYDRQAHTIHFPKYASFSSDRLKVDPSLSEVQAAVDDLFKAVGLHEIGHPLYTSPGHSHGEDLAHGLFWSLEDIRCDSFSQGRLAGGSRIFDAGYRRLISMGYWIPLKDSASAEDIFQAWVLFQGRHLLARQAAFADLGNGAELLLEQFAGKPFVQGAWQILLKLKTTTSSWDVVPIVDELLKYLKQSASPQSQGSASDKSGQSSAGDDDPSSPDDSGSNSVPSRSLPDPTDGQPAKPSGDGSGSDEQPSSKRSSTETSAPTDDSASGGSGSRSQDSSESPSSSPAASASASGQESNGPSHQQGASSRSPVKGSGCDDQGASASSPGGESDDTSAAASVASAVLASGWDAVQSISDVLRDALADASVKAIASGAKQVELVAGVPAKRAPASYDCSDVRPLTMRLRNLLLAQAPVMRSNERRGSRVDGRALARVPFGEREVFLEVKRSPVVYSSVKVIVDCSLSMAGGRIQIAREAALRVCTAIADIRGTRVSASAFPEAIGGRRDQVLELLPFGGQVRDYAGSFLRLTPHSWAGTPMAPALYSAMLDLLRERELKKICLVLSDGQTDSKGAAEAPVIAQMRLAGIQVLGLGIGTMANHELFDRFEIVNDLKELEHAMLSLLQSSMLRRAAA